MHLSDKALLVHLGISQWTAKKLDKKASAIVSEYDVGNYNKSLLPTCDLHEAVKAETALIRKEFYRNVLPWSIEGTFILASANYLPFMVEYRQKKARWLGMVAKFLDIYPQAQQDAERILNLGEHDLYNENDYPSPDELRAKFSMELTVLPVPTAGDFRVEMIDEEFKSVQADIEQRVAESFQIATKEVWSRLFDQVSWLHARLADPKNAYHDETYYNAVDLVKLLKRLNISNDPELEALRLDAENKLFSAHPQTLANDPVMRHDATIEAQAIMDKMSVFMGKL